MSAPSQLIFSLIDSFEHVFAPDGSNGLGPSVQPRNAPIDPLYRTPIRSIVSPSKVRLPSTYSSAAGSASSLARDSADRLISKVRTTLWSKSACEPAVSYFGSGLSVCDFDESVSASAGSSIFVTISVSTAWLSATSETEVFAPTWDASLPEHAATTTRQAPATAVRACP